LDDFYESDLNPSAEGGNKKSHDEDDYEDERGG
jgi:hypothetical protein